MTAAYDREKPSGETTALTSVMSAIGPIPADDGEIKERARRGKNNMVEKEKVPEDQ
jgi:hypothetical protein